MSSPLVIIQARLNSKRFPNKIQADICGLSMLGHVVMRASRIAPVVVAFPKDEEDENDVLSRYARVARANPDADPIIRITADCPLLDSGLALGLLHRYQNGRVDILGTSPAFDGLDVEIYSRVALRNADMFAQSQRDREHVTPWMKRHLLYEEVTLRGPALRWSVDDEDGLTFVRRVFEACGHCRGGVPHHTNAATSIGGSDRSPVWDLHQLDEPSNRGGLVECTAYEILMSRTGGDVYESA
jgi:spore coat polysaccharide biosynthesis protein SpsF (cytidylyltransferase family)